MMEEVAETEEGVPGVSPDPLRVAAVDEGVASLEDVLEAAKLGLNGEFQMPGEG